MVVPVPSNNWRPVPLNVPPSSAVTPAFTLNVDCAGKLNGRVLVKLPRISKVPLFIVTAPLEAPSAKSLLTMTEPALIFTPPVKALLVPSVSEPVFDFTMLAVPAIVPGPEKEYGSVLFTRNWYGRTVVVRLRLVACGLMPSL